MFRKIVFMTLAILLTWPSMIADLRGQWLMYPYVKVITTNEGTIATIAEIVQRPHFKRF